MQADEYTQSESEPAMESLAGPVCVAALGGPAAAARMLGTTTSWVARWTYPKGKRGGTGGLIPAPAQRKLATLIEAKKIEGLTLSDVVGTSHRTRAARRRRKSS
jgi:hypothetical protein